MSKIRRAKNTVKLMRSCCFFNDPNNKIMVTERKNRKGRKYKKNNPSNSRKFNISATGDVEQQENEERQLNDKCAEIHDPDAFDACQYNVDDAYDGYEFNNKSLEEIDNMDDTSLSQAEEIIKLDPNYTD